MENLPLSLLGVVCWFQPPGSSDVKSPYSTVIFTVKISSRLLLLCPVFSVYTWEVLRDRPGWFSPPSLQSFLPGGATLTCYLLILWESKDAVVGDVCSLIQL